MSLSSLGGFDDNAWGASNEDADIVTAAIKKDKLIKYVYNLCRSAAESILQHVGKLLLLKKTCVVCSPCSLATCLLREISYA